MGFENTEVELRVGEKLWIGECLVTLIEIDGGEVVFKIDDSQAETPVKVAARPR